MTEKERKDYILEWVLTYGTGWISAHQHPCCPLWIMGKDAGFIHRDRERRDERISQKGVEYINE